MRIVDGALLTAILGLSAIGGACFTAPDFPPSVESGNGGGGGSSTGAPTSDATTGDDANDTGDAGATFACTTASAMTCTTYADVPSTLVSSLQALCTGTTAACTATSVVGCCVSTASGYTEEQCFYGTNTNALGTSAGCSNSGGTYSLTPSL